MFPYSVFNTRSASSGGWQDTQQGATMTGTSTIYSDSWNGENEWAADVFYTGTPTGTFTLWAANRMNPSLADDSHWVDITSTVTVSNPAGAAGKFSVRAGTAARGHLLRWKYVNASGTGVATSFVTTHGHR